MESSICSLTKWLSSTEGWWTFKADSVFLIQKGACVVVEDIVLHFKREFGHVPKSVANAFVEVWKQTLVIRVVPCYGSWHNPIYRSSACGIIVRHGDLEGKSIWGSVGELQWQIPASAD